jgi:hypothetical protein
MGTAFGILLFVLVYGPVAYLAYDELTGRRSRIRARVVRAAHPRRTRRVAARGPLSTKP